MRNNSNVLSFVSFEDRQQKVFRIGTECMIRPVANCTADAAPLAFPRDPLQSLSGDSHISRACTRS